MHAHCASGCCGSHTAWPCPCPVNGTERLASAAALVACYEQTQGSLAAEHAYYSTLASPAEALSEALLALGDDDGLRPDHTPLAKSTVKQLVAALEPLGGTLATSDDFTELHAKLLQAGEEQGLEPTAAYDTALRFGMQTGLLPNAVFCHAGNRDALCAHGIDQPAFGWVSPSSLPDVISTLPPHEIERCFSLCRNQWQRLAMTLPKENV